MTAIFTTAHEAGAQRTCARNDTAGFQPVLRRDILRAIRTCRTSFGLSTGDVLVLDALLSFLPCRDRGTRADRPIAPDMLLVIYASNRSICDRANGMDERVMRRHVARLSAKGLVARKDSATGKRFPLKSAGKVKDAFGIDLTPLLSSSRGIIESAQAIVEEQEAIRNVRSQALSVRASILRQSQRIGSEILSMVDEAKKLLRRASLTIEAAKIILKDMMRIASSLEQQECPAQEIDVPAAEPEMYHGTIDETAEESAASGQDVRQVEPQKKDTYKISTRQNDTIDAIWERCKHIRDFFPVMPRTQSEFREHIYLSGKMIALSERCMARGISTLGWSRMLEVLNYLIGNIARIKSPEAYLTAVIGRETAMKKAQDLAPA